MRLPPWRNGEVTMIANSMVGFFACEFHTSFKRITHKPESLWYGLVRYTIWGLPQSLEEGNQNERT